MQRITIAIGAVLLALVLVTPSQASSVAFFYDASYVDTTREGPNLKATLESFGHTVSTFTGITAADFTSALSGAHLIVFPEMENGDLNDDLDAAARAVLTAYVNGGGLMIQANAFVANTSLPNALFGYSLTQSGMGSSSLDVAEAAGTPFAGGPAVLPASDAVEGILSSSLPAGARNIYHDGSGQTAVLMTSYGAGKYVYLGFDWFEEPTPAAWAAVAGLAAENVVPEPSTLILVAAGLGGLVLVRRRRR